MSTGGLSNLSEDKDGLTDGPVVGSEEREPLSKTLSIDLDRKLASFHMSDLPDADDIPITQVTDNYIGFSK